MKFFALSVVASTLAFSTASAESDIDELAELLVGSFDSLVANPEQPLEDRLIDKRIRVSNPALGNYVFYQQINHREDLSVYRQRVLLVMERDGELLQRAYVIKKAEDFVDADAAAFETLSSDDIEAFMPAGCAQTWTRIDGGFRGYVDPKQCVITSSRTGLPRQIEAENTLTEEYEALAERGYDGESGEQLFGTEQGESYRLDRVDTD